MILSGIEEIEGMKGSSAGRLLVIRVSDHAFRASALTGSPLPRRNLILLSEVGNLTESWQYLVHDGYQM